MTQNLDLKNEGTHNYLAARADKRVLEFLELKSKSENVI
jgi:hypothetical protein